MAGLQGTTVIHGNHGFFEFDGKIVGRAKNITMSVEGGMDEFYEVGSAWVQDLEVINRKVQVEIERGSIDFKLLAYAVGAKATLDASGTPAAGTNTFKDSGGVNYDLIIDDTVSNVLTISPDGGGTQFMTSPFSLNVIINANKITSPVSISTYSVTAMDCKIMRHGVTAPNSAYWTTNMTLTGKQIKLTMPAPMHVIT